VRRDFDRIFGRTPSVPVTFVLLNGVEQYNEFCAGQIGVVPDRRSYSRLRQAFLTDSWIDTQTGELRTVGVGLWDTSSEPKWWTGLQACRLALALSMVEAVDPSPVARESMGKKVSVDEEFVELYFAEKKLPAWFSWGAATYIERYFIDNLVSDGGNTHWAPQWTMGHIRDTGGLDPLPEIFALKLSAGEPEAMARSERWIDQTGLLLSFMLDGSCAPVREAHAAFKEAFARGDNFQARMRALEKALVKHEAELRKYAGL
jgi:hypothetical protein